MPGALDEWQERLERHFSELAASRSGTGFPVFALEHGLKQNELDEIAKLLRSRLAAGFRLAPHWLLWVVYATEQAYRYDGFDYWGPFEEATPHWRDQAARRTRLRSYFSKFQKTYDGVIPTGRWAEWFRNIAWPITHAILPRYLQLQFAKALYDARHQFARTPDLTPATAGKLLVHTAWDASSRFQEFLEQEELAGRIVVALLEQGSTQGQSPIYAPTLERIVADVVQVRRAGEWLKETRRVVSDRFHGVDRSRPGYTRGPAPGPRPSPAAAGLSLRPGLLLRRSSGESWWVVVEVPSFEGVARISSELTRFLKATRCTIAGTDDAMLPAGWTLYGPQRRILKSWPQSGPSMIVFERPDAVLDNILRGECRFPEGPVWVFRIGSDGIAREIASRSVRPGQPYILLSREPLKTGISFARPTQIDCRGVSGLTLEMPDAVQAEESAKLHKLGIQVSRNIRVWPAGLCIRNWDGEGHGDWLTTEATCFGIIHDYAVDDYHLRLDSGPEVRIAGAMAGRPVFIRLPPLPPGRHVLSVRARRVGLRLTAQELRDLEGRIELNVRDPEPWKPGTTAHSGLAVSLDPPNPTLDDFWEGNVRLSVLGPDSRDVECSITLTGTGGEAVLSEEIGRFALPIQPSTWFQRFQRFANDDARAWKYLDAASGRFAVNAEELGEYALLLERDARPVRWICRAAAHETQVRLIDDTGEVSPAAIEFFPLKQPGQSQSLDGAAILDGIVVEEPGGLFVATQGQHCDALVVSSSRGFTGLENLLIEPELDGLASDPARLLTFVDLWHRACLAGPLAESRREHIVERFLARIYAAICGQRWGKAEAAFLRNSRARNFWPLEQAIQTRTGFPAVLRLDHARMAQGTAAGARWFSEVAARYGISKDPKLCEFALRLASAPFELETAYGQDLRALLGSIQHHPILMRGARFLALVCISTDDDYLGSHLPNWSW
jgi:hypothetical protein